MGSIGSKAGMGNSGGGNGMEHPEQGRDVGADSQEKEE